MEIMDDWVFNELDKKMAEEIASFIPKRVFDSHAHIWRKTDWNSDISNVFTQGPKEVTMDVWRKYIGRQVGLSKLVGGLFLGMPLCAIDRMNNFLVEQLKNEPESRGSINISPEYSKEKVSEYLKNPFIVGFKPYYTFNKKKPTFQSSIAGFLPEWAWKMADERGLVITLHMVKSLAIADPENQREIREMCSKYPNAKLILAHAARGFHAPNTIKGIASLRGLENIWFDTSAICESAPFFAILHEFGPNKLLWGSDFAASECRGKCVTIGDGFAWFDDTVLMVYSIVDSAHFFYCSVA